MVNQEFNRDNYELIFVEQRNRQMAAKNNKSISLPTLADLQSQYADHFNFSVKYLDLPISDPYHLGKLVNAGISQARGEIISVMDGDEFVTPEFLTHLSKMHTAKTPLWTLYRKMAKFPASVPSYASWHKATFTYASCLRCCTDRYLQPFSRMPINNYGPMVSAPRKLWDAIGGYDERVLWSTSASTAHADAAKRLELASAKRFFTLPWISAVHPWHPLGYAAKERKRDRQVRRFIGIQGDLTAWSTKYGMFDWRDREALSITLEGKERVLIDYVITGDRNYMNERTSDEYLAKNCCQVAKEVRRQQRQSLIAYPRNLLRLVSSGDLMSAPALRKTL